MADVNKIHSKYASLFEKLSNKLACLVYSRTDGDKAILKSILDDLNSLDFNLNCVKNNDRAVLVINQCCYLIPADEEELVSKACSLFLNLVTKQQSVVEGKTLLISVSWHLECLKHRTSVTVLNCLQALIRGNGRKIEKQCNQLIASISDILNKCMSDADSETSQERCLYCLKCVESLVCPDADENEKLSAEVVLQCLSIFTQVLYGNSKLRNELIHCKFLITAMRGIEYVVQQLNDCTADHLNDIFGIVKGYMLYGLPGHDGYKVQKVFPSKVAIPEVLKPASPGAKKLKGKYDRKSKKMTITPISTVEETEDVKSASGYVSFSEKFREANTAAPLVFKTSDSDYSDSETSQNSKLRSQQSKVRHCALILLGAVVQKSDAKLITWYLPSFIPDGLQVPHTRTLVTCLLKDPSPKCRSEVLGILSTLISNSKQYLSQADSISKSSFTTLASGIGNMIKELHRCLALALIAENLNTVITRILKCIADLIRCSPYYKLESGLVTKLSRHVRPYLKHKDVNVQISALTAFGCIISVEPKIQEIRDIITKPLQDTKSDGASCNEESQEPPEKDSFEIFEEDESESLTVKPWLFESCLRNLTDASDDSNQTNATNVALVIESLQVLGALVRNFFWETVVSFPKDIIHFLEYCSSRPEYPIRLYAGKFMETIFNSLQFNLSDEDESRRASVSLVILLWESLLMGPVTALMQSEGEPMLRSTGCDCIANIGVQVNNGHASSIQNSLIFDQLSRDKQIICITHLFGGIRDESPAVRSSSARALAIFVMFPSLREDSLFFLDAIDSTISVAADEHNGVRSQSAWLLGNLSEAILLSQQQNVQDGVNDEVIFKLLKTGIKLSQDTPKIKPGAVRGVGNLLRVVSEEFVKKYRDIVVEGLEVLIKNATTGSFMKARWNSCYAVASLLQNPVIYNNTDWVSKIFTTMMTLIQHYKNFKVRISACCVLSVPPTRESYGDHYCSLWSAILNALENSKNVSDLNEYQHRDQLVVQLCLTMCHLVSLITVDDLASVQDIFVFHLDNLEHSVKRFQERIVPEKSSIILSASARVNSLMDVKNLSADQKSALRMLENLFAADR